VLEVIFTVLSEDQTKIWLTGSKDVEVDLTWVHPVSCTLGTGISFLGFKAVGV